MITERLRQDSRQQRSAMRQDGKRIQEELNSGRQLTSGLLIANGVYCLNETVRNMAQQKEMEHQDKERAKRQKDCQELMKRRQAMNALRASKGNTFSLYNSKECKLYLQYKKHDNDTTMPIQVDELHSRCQAILHRSSPPASPHASDDKYDGEY